MPAIIVHLIQVAIAGVIFSRYTNGIIGLCKGSRLGSVYISFFMPGESAGIEKARFPKMEMP